MEGAVFEKLVLELGETGFCETFWGPWVQGWVGVVCLGPRVHWAGYCCISKHTAGKKRICVASGPIQLAVM